MNINNAFPSKWLKSGDIPANADLVLTIKSVTVETIGQGEQADTKPVVYFAEVDKGLVLNKTNANTIARLYGPETDGWEGKRIGLFATEVDFAGKQTLAIRVRLRVPGADNGQKKLADRPALWAAYVELTRQAAEAGLNVTPLPETAAVPEIVEAGKALRAQIAEATQF